MKIAIIGSGISGQGIAYLLKPEHDITVYEKNAYIGGHSRTIEVQTGDQMAPVDTGFIVFNNWNYPNLMGLFKLLDVPYEKSDMSFGVSIDDGFLEYGSYNMFAQKKNLLRPAYYKMLADVLKFNKQAEKYIESDADVTLQECLDELNMGDWFRNYYLLAMGAAIWSCPVKDIMKFPARTFLRFFKNHGLLSVNNRPQWYTVSGGSREYIKRLSASFKDDVRLNCGVNKVAKNGDKLHVTDENGETEIYDRVVFACHADQAMKMIEAPSKDVEDIIGSFSFQKNKIVVHSDLSFMPQNKKCWASWVYLSDEREDEKQVVSLSYWMNNLQNFNKEHPVIVTLNPGRQPKESLIMDEHNFSHPIFDVKAINAQEKVPSIQGENGMYFCGAYQRYGFHEDGLLSAVNVAKEMGVKTPWE